MNVASTYGNNCKDYFEKYVLSESTSIQSGHSIRNIFKIQNALSAINRFYNSEHIFLITAATDMPIFSLYLHLAQETNLSVINFGYY